MIRSIAQKTWEAFCRDRAAEGNARQRHSPPGNPVQQAGRSALPAAPGSWDILLVMVLCGIWVLLSSSPGAAEPGVPKPGLRDKCPVCGMFVAKYPDWMAAIHFRDGSHVYADGAKDMFKYLHDLKKYDHVRKPEEIQTVLVMDYYRLSWIDARSAWYVLGSDVFGPMGRELIPLEHKTDAEEFMKDHRGTRIVRFADITREVIKTLD
ncbi:MAG: nitrous oxide reductase accessory protein NosL [Deltaproteobacteria bacterium]|nr:nitrous oxide reductase accessory protein NosL [Deltaproteobacteria bacterium]